MSLMNYCLFVLAVTMTVVLGQQDTCRQLTDCFEDKVKAGEDIPSKKTEKLRQGSQIGDCGGREANEIADMMDLIREKRQERHDRVQKCVEGDARSFPGCPALRRGAVPRDAPRECASDRREFREIFTGGRLGNSNGLTRGKRQARGRGERRNAGRINRKQAKQECKALQCGCPEAKLCHECYEISDLHDEIHTLKMEMDLMRIKCNVPQRPQKGQFRSPALDETIDEAFTS